jgi:hypothetical protein
LQDILPIKEYLGALTQNKNCSARRAAGVSRRCKAVPVLAISRGVRLAPARGQSGEQSAPAAPARRGLQLVAGGSGRLETVFAGRT